LGCSKAFHTKKLVDVESHEFRRSQPMEMENFQAYQTDCCEKSKALLWTVRCHTRAQSEVT
jgi:hypothetical protein